MTSTAYTDRLAEAERERSEAIALAESCNALSTETLDLAEAAQKQAESLHVLCALLTVVAIVGWAS
ncbi:MAG: hypothetical protein H6515_12980 [Microthrixaceae bacterium]|nr:hypothetical protein [Microthrixaceae bacterium]